MERAHYGTWLSPLSAADLARSAIALNYVQVAGGTPYWVESRPAEGGRYVIVTHRGADRSPVAVLTPPGFNVRTRVHEYGGTPYFVRGDAVYFTHYPDQRLYLQRLGPTNLPPAPGGEPVNANAAAPVPLTPEGYRYADFAGGSSGSRLFCVREDHTGGGEPKNTVVALDPAGLRTGQLDENSAGTVLFGNSDFVAYPRVSPDGRHIAWVAWNHPNMPWDATTLYVADLTGSGLANVTAIAGAPGRATPESVMEPRWDRDGTLYFVADRSNWWNLYRYRNGRVERVFALDAELASPLWTLGQSNYALTGDGRAVVRYGVAALDQLGVVTLDSGRLDRLALPFVALSNIQLLSSGTAIAIAASSTEEAAVVTIDLTTRRHRVLRAPSELKLDTATISVAEPIEFPTHHGRTAHAFYYPPVNPNFAAPDKEKPPLVVKVHGGPTSHSKAELSPGTQYWTSRGFGLLDVNHGGSSGFGREYRDRLNGNWGIIDVGDVVAAVKHLIAAGRIDPNRVAIRGGSAGGFTVLAALAFHNVFKAGANYYGVSDLVALAHDTHKFESRYLDRLVAPLPEGLQTYEERAPIRHLDGFNAPLITFQGVEDKVVPPDQSRAIVAALRAKGVPVAYIEFEGEQHGFRKAENIVRSLESELAFYGKVFGFTPAGSLPPVRME